MGFPAVYKTAAVAAEPTLLKYGAKSVNRTQAGALPMRRSTTKLTQPKTWSTVSDLNGSCRFTKAESLPLDQQCLKNF